ncbi:hypothetical protein N2152v2_010909 [Parachlorella kessleri]
MADEASFFDLLIASERVEGWLALIASGPNQSRLTQALQELATAVDAKEAYAEEARLAGAVPILTRLLKRTDDEQQLELASDIIAACSGPMATANKVREFSYEGVPVVIKEGALGDGVGAKLWTVAHTLCRELATHPDIVRGQRVLEIGSGCGACGILAAQLGAAEVVMTDYLEAILANLRACMHLNAGAAEQHAQQEQQEGHQVEGLQGADSRGANNPETLAAANGHHHEGLADAIRHGTGALRHRQDLNGSSSHSSELETTNAAGVETRERVGDVGCGGEGGAEAELEFDPEDASECSDLDDFFAEAVGAAGSQRTQQQQQQQQQQQAALQQLPETWDARNMHVRFLDWADSVAYIHRHTPELRPHPGAAHLHSPRRAQQAQQAQQKLSGLLSSTPAAAGGPDVTMTASGIPSPRRHCSADGGRRLAPGLPEDDCFPVVLGTDILYEWPMVEMVACVLKHRLAPGGRALLCCAVREQAMFDAFAARLQELGLRLGITQVLPKMDDGGILGRERDYEGGFVMMAAEHAASPATDWHRDDLFS